MQSEPIEEINHMRGVAGQYITFPNTPRGQ